MGHESQRLSTHEKYDRLETAKPFCLCDRNGFAASLKFWVNVTAIRQHPKIFRCQIKPFCTITYYWEWFLINNFCQESRGKGLLQFAMFTIFRSV